MKTSTLGFIFSTHFFLTFLLFILFKTFSFGQTKRPSDWSVSAGMGLATLPSYPGDDQYQLVVVPSIRIQYSDRFFASILEGVGYNMVLTDHWRIGPILKNHIGRYEDGTVPSSIAGRKTTDLIGLGDIGFAAEPGAFIEFTQKAFITKLEIRQGLGGHQGLIGELRSAFQGRVKFNKSHLIYRAGPELRFANSTYQNAFFGINAEQAANTELAKYEAETGLLSYGLNGSIGVPIHQKLSMIAFARYQRLGVIASDSPLVQGFGSSNQSTFGMLLQYAF
ncbi:MAG: MipA/OmpV family protein [Bacteroidota bacterium]